jgi:DNA-binding beta-propeller fold protein YncE
MVMSKIGSLPRRNYRIASVAALVALSASAFATALAGPPRPDTLDESPAYVAPSKYQFGHNGFGPTDMVEPNGLAVDSQNRVYVADCALDHIQVFTEAGAHLSTIGGPEPQLGSLRCPAGLALAPDGRLLVVDAGHRRVQSYDAASGAFLGTAIDDPEIVRPFAVSTAGKMIAISDPGAESVRFYDLAGSPLHSCGTAGEAPGSFANPQGVALDGQGTLYVADQQNHRIQQVRSDCSVVRSWGVYGGRPGDMAEPSDVRFVDGHVYVADLTNHRLQVFDAHGNYLYEWGRHPPTAHEGNGRTHYPYLVAVNPQNSIAVVGEPFEVRLQTFDLAAVRDFVQKNVRAQDDPYWNKSPRFHYGTGVVVVVIKRAALPLEDAPGWSRPLAEEDTWGLAIAEPDISRVAVIEWTEAGPKLRTSIGGFGSDPGLFKQPSGVVQDPETLELYVADAYNHRIQVITPDGEFIRSFGTFGLAPGSMNAPGGLDFDSEGNLLVVQAHANRIDSYSKAGEYLGTFGEPGSGPAQFNRPIQIRYNPRLDRIYVNDLFNQRIQILTGDGQYIGEFGHDLPGLSPGHLIDSLFSAIDEHNNIYVTDTASNRVLKFDQDGHLLAHWGSFGSEIGQFYKPKGIAVRGDRVYVLDFGNHRGQIFTLDGEPLGIFGEDVLYPRSTFSDPS